MLVRRLDGGGCLAYPDILRELTCPQVCFSPSVCPSSAADAVRALAFALALDRPLTLYDPLFSESERKALDASDEVQRQCVMLPGVVERTAESLVARMRSARNFRLSLFTSGSTGLPKKVTHRVETLARAVRVNETHSQAVWALCYNPTHMAGVQVILQALFNGNATVDCFGQDPDAILSGIEREGITHLSATPSFYRLLPLTGQTFPSVRRVTLGGERADNALLDRLRKAFPGAGLRNIYASTEAGALLAADGDVFSIPPDLAGRIRIRQERIEVHRDFLGEGTLRPGETDWYETGDVIEIVAPDPLRFRIVRRDREWINVGGEKVDPEEVADAIRRCPQVRDARVFGRANSLLGSILCAEVVVREPVDEAGLRAYLAGVLHPHRVPRVIRFVASLPLGRTGKAAAPE